MARSLDLAFADSDATRVFIEKFLGLKNIIVIPYFFSFKMNDTERKFNPYKIKLAYFGRMCQEKGTYRAIEFCKLCNEKGIDFTFDIYGSGELEDCTSKVNEYGLQKKVIVKGVLPLNKVISTMQQYDFLLHLSYQEGMGLSVVEAMNCGLVPIVAPAGEIASYSKDGVNAIWLDTVESDELGVLFVKLQDILLHPAKYRLLSKAAVDTFVGYKKYSDSLIQGVSSYLKEQPEETIA
jgi:glycosyltransferase involved in cell wall biosynthesis